MTARSTWCSSGCAPPRPTRNAPSPRWCARRPGGRAVPSDLIAPSAGERDAFDRLHQLIDPSHVRAFLEEELGEVPPDPSP